MQYKPASSLCATVAIAATLALGSTPVFAQETAPAISVAPAPAAPAAAPAIEVPTVTVQPTAPQPVAAEPVATTAERATPRAQPSRSAPRAAPAARGPVAAAPVASRPAAPVAAAPAEPVAQAPIATTSPAPVAEPAPAARPAETDGPTGEEMGFLAMLAALGVGGMAFLASRLRRRRSLDEIEAAEYVDPAPIAPAVAPAAVVERPVTAESTMDRVQPAAAVPRPALAGPIATGPIATGPIPAGPIPAGEARQALLDRMVAAEPDEANPFTSPKARRKRARLILQAREAEQGETQPFDWRTYEPSTRREREPEPELA